jgi:SRSO17 transposase
VGPTAWAVDDTGFPKDGDHSVGVQRQYSGTLGKTANCQLGVSVSAVTEQASCPLDWRLFLPESWDQDLQRRAACHVPARVRHRPKWQLVLDMLDELGAWGLVAPVLVADSGYGEVGEFRQGLDDRQIPSVVEVKADTSAYPEQVRPTTAPYTGKGRRHLPLRRWLERAQPALRVVKDADDVMIEVTRKRTSGTDTSSGERRAGRR